MIVSFYEHAHLPAPLRMYANMQEDLVQLNIISLYNLIKQTPKNTEKVQTYKAENAMMT